jgi:Rho-binding antiterminator
MQTDYKPIACHFYDELEDLAVKKIKSKIIFTQNENTKEIEDFIIDFKTLNKQEFIILSSGLEIRLDKIISVNDSKPLATC